MRRYDKDEERRRKSRTVSASDGELLTPIDARCEQARLAERGFVPCGLSQTWTSCPVCGQLLGQFRSGMAGLKWFSPTTAETVMAETVETAMLWCRGCRKGYT